MKLDPNKLETQRLLIEVEHEIALARFTESFSYFNECERPDPNRPSFPNERMHWMYIMMLINSAPGLAPHHSFNHAGKKRTVFKLKSVANQGKNSFLIVTETGNFNGPYEFHFYEYEGQTPKDEFETAIKESIVAHHPGLKNLKKTSFPGLKKAYTVGAETDPLKLNVLAFQGVPTGVFALDLNKRDRVTVQFGKDFKAHYKIGLVGTDLQFGADANLQSNINGNTQLYFYLKAIEK